FEPVDLAEVVRAVTPRARWAAEERGHSLTVRLDENSRATVWGDYAALNRLLLILIDNAAKYTPAPGDIRVSLAAGEQTATLAVEDNGIGISPTDQPRIFGRFFRADPSRSQVEGSGLGLSIALWIANVHQASLSVDSEENRGSTFKIAFPLL